MFSKNLHEIMFEFILFQRTVKSTENQSIANVKKKLELEKEEAVKKVKEETKVCTYSNTRHIQKTKMIVQ